MRVGDADAALQVLRAGTTGVSLIEVDDDELVPEQHVRPVLLAQLREVVQAATRGDDLAALAALDRHRLLCAHRTGPRGVAWWAQRVPRWLADELTIQPRRDGRFAGQPLLVRANDHDNGLWNGDTGVVVADGDELVASFSTGGAPRRVPLGRLGDVRPMHAMTVHRAQGSQFDAVTVVLPPASSPLGTRETVYTAITRAQSAVTIVGSSVALTAALARPVQRASGLRTRLA